MAGEPTPIRLMLASIRCEKRDLEANLAAHLRVLAEAAGEGCQLAVFPEMSLSGSVDPVKDPNALLRIDSPAISSVVESTQRHSVGAVFGIAERGDNGASHITQIYASQGRLIGAYRKRHLGEGEEGFTPGTESAVFRYGALSFGIAICAEGSVDYPFDEQAAAGAEIVFFCAAPGLHGRRTDDDSWRQGHAWWESEGLRHARRHASRTGTWVALVTQAGSTVDEDFPGLAALVSPNGEVVARLPDWKEGLLTVDVPVGFEVEPHARGCAASWSSTRQAGHCLSGSPMISDTTGGRPQEADCNQERITSRRRVRELLEELGRDDIDIGPEIGWRRHTLSFNGAPWITQHERWFMARHAPFDVAPEHVATLAAEAVTDIRWWSSDDLAGSGFVTSPRRLPDLLGQLASGRLPPPDTNLGV